MGLFSRRRRDDDADRSTMSEDVATVEADGPDDEADGGGPGSPAGSRGPFDVGDVPELGTRLDLGTLRIPTRAGLQMRLEMEKTTRTVVAVSLGLGDSSMQLQAFAAPRSTGIWDELRGEIADSLAKQNGRSEERAGPFGTELAVRLPATAPDGSKALRPARFVGVDGPRWFLRAVFTGRGAVDAAAAAPLEEILAGVVVVRGPEAHAPRDVLLLSAPGRSGVEAGATDPSVPDPLRRGPEMTEVR